MDQDKVGEPFIILTLFFFCLVMSRHTFIYHTDKPREQHKHVKGKVPSIPNYTTINRRINRLDIKIKEDDSKSKEFKDQYIIIAMTVLASRLQ